MKQGFSLVELSIVLVILGLLVGGVLAGKSLIRASELRAVSSELTRYIAANKSFRDKYFQLPGDMTNATAFWQLSATATTCTNRTSAASSATGTCDGDGDNRIENAGGATGDSGEIFQFWRQLQLAGMIEGNYTGVAIGASSDATERGTNVPPSKIGLGAWFVGNTLTNPNTSTNFSAPGGYNNYFLVGTVTNPLNPPVGALFRPEEAWNIDTKIDDGVPSTGIALARAFNGSCVVFNSGVAAHNNYDASYNLTYATPICVLYFVRQV